MSEEVFKVLDINGLDPNLNWRREELLSEFIPEEERGLVMIFNLVLGPLTEGKVAQIFLEGDTLRTVKMGYEVGGKLNSMASRLGLEIHSAVSGNRKEGYCLYLRSF